MIRVLIAEDEPPTMRRLKRLIEQTDPDFEVVAEAGDGERAIELLQTTPVDVVFTDIRMPVLDGLAVMDAVHADYPQVLVVAVSGYQDFAYVSHAVRAQILDYLLKPVSREAMAELLARVKATHAEQSRRAIGRQLAAHLNRSEVVPRASSSRTSRLAVCLFCAGPMPLGEDAEMYPGAAAWGDVMPDQALTALRPDRHGFAWAFMGSTAVERILIVELKGDDPRVLLMPLHAWLSGQTAVPVSCACAPEGVMLQETGGMIRALRKRLQSTLRIGTGIFVTLDDPAPVEPAPDPEAAAKLASLIRTGRLNRTAPFFRELLLRIEQEAWTQQRITTLFMRALTLCEAEPELAAQARTYREVISESLSTALSLDELAEGLGSLGPMDAAAASDTPEQRGIADRVAEYLRTHYQEHINNQTLAAAFGYVPSYISMLFRKAHGVSPAEYLTHVRLEEAKRLMQDDPHMLIREVAARVGFKSQHHFSRTFKKNEGMWPTSYQS